MVVSVPDAIAYLSRHTTLRPGDIVAMGTPKGVGPISDGDVMTACIEGIGLLRNPVAREVAPHADS
jgi:2-keto-4-pentenoate hydratase/2-oxohepta-3-ene-1,7-dioic acid hydratase in catechol pathway